MDYAVKPPKPAMPATPGPNITFLSEKDLQFLPPYLRDVPEVLEEVECKTSGHWPPWLQGSLVRIGVGKYTVPTSADGSRPNAVLQHFFDGLAYLHKFTIDGPKVRYRSQCTANGLVERCKKNGFFSSPAPLFSLDPNTPLREAQDPCSALLGSQQTLFVPEGHLGPDDMNIMVSVRRGYHLPADTNALSRGTDKPVARPDREEVMTMTDANFMQVCDAKTLLPKRLVTYADIDGRLAGFGICAHPPKDRVRGMIFNYLIDPSTGVMSVFALDIRSKPAQLLWKTSLPCAPCYVHSLAMTEKYVIFTRNPMIIDPSDMTKPLMDAMHYEPHTPAAFHVLDKMTGEYITTYTGAEFIYFHAANAYDFVDPLTGETNIHVDLCIYDNDSVTYKEYCLSNLASPGAPFSQAHLVRFELRAVNLPSQDKEVKKAATARAFPVPLEVPRIAKSASMHPYRYVYGLAGLGQPSPATEVPIGRMPGGGINMKVVQAQFFGDVVKCDWRTGGVVRWTPPDGESCPSEPIFVARPGGKEEDDGVVLTILCDRAGGHSMVVCLDAGTLREVARARMPCVFPAGPHGTFVEKE